MLEKAHGGYLNPVKIYARATTTAPSCALRRSRKPEHALSWVNCSFDELVARIEANPCAYSLIKYNGINHFSPFVREVAEASAVVTPKKRKASPPPRPSKKQATLVPEVAADAPYAPEPGFVVLPKPTGVAIGAIVAHRFDKAAWPRVWASGGRVLRVSSEQGYYEVKYMGHRDLYLHQLALADYGPTRTWVLIAKK